jgi:hypothetical protein
VLHSIAARAIYSGMPLDTSTATRKPAQARAATRIFEPRTFSRRTRQRFARNREAELLRSLGRELSYPEKILISRIVACEWDLRRIDAQLDRGEELSAHMARHRYAIENRLRLDLRELGLQPAADETPGAVENPIITAEVRDQLLRVAQKDPDGARALLAALTGGAVDAA